MNFIFRVIEKYEISYPNPIRLQKGDVVTITKYETNAEWAGWAYCVDQKGVEGWVSPDYLKISGSTAVVTKNYNATELAVEKEELVLNLREEYGWAWVKNRLQQEGWIPVKNVEKYSGYYAVIFTSKRCDSDSDAYEKMAERMIELAGLQKGFIAVQSERDAEGFGTTVSYWQTREDIASWKNNDEHLHAQKLGRDSWYESYNVRIEKIEN
ncbi:MAG: SH3 domain-containing protein [Pseudobdellovibrio sp.]